MEFKSFTIDFPFYYIPLVTIAVIALIVIVYRIRKRK